jgi:arginine N-succinyltransferase
VRSDDLDALIRLARKAGVGVTSLQPDGNLLAERIARSIATLEGQAEPADQGYLFVLEDTSTKQVVGISGIEVAVGLKDPWYNFRIGSISHISRELSVYQKVEALFLSNDHAGYSELCTLFLDPEWRHSRNGQLLSKSRFLFLAAFKERFAKKVVAEMRGMSNEQGHSPFWEGLGRHFFNIDFAKADYLTGIGEKTFIAELMPRFPVYINMLPPAAQEVIGKVHAQTEPAKAMLEAEGFRHEGYVDIFDGGATLEAYVNELRIVRESRLYQADTVAEIVPAEKLFLISNDRDKQFRVILAHAADLQDSFQLTAEQAAALELQPGDSLRAVPLYQ